MELLSDKLRSNLPYLSKTLIQEIINHSLYKELTSDTEILREGNYVRAIPIVINGLIKVYSRYEDKELLLYYIEPYQSCIMSFSAAFANEPSKIFAVVEENTETLLLPVEKVNAWIKQYPELNNLFFNQYNLRYTELLETIRHLLYFKLDKRIYDYLLDKSRIKGTRELELKHKQIAFELGTAREVVSRILKKLEKEEKILQQGGNIIIL